MPRPLAATPLPLAAAPPLTHSLTAPPLGAAPDLPPCVGGDIRTRLSDINIDRIIGDFTLLPADTFYMLRHRVITPEAVRAGLNRPGITVIHICQHWVVALIRSPEEPWLVFDSAHSEVVRRELAACASRLGWRLPPVYYPCPQQLRGSDECGLFAIMHTLLLHRGISVPKASPRDARVSLGELRNLYPDAEAMFRAGCAILGIILPAAPALLSPSPFPTGPHTAVGGAIHHPTPATAAAQTAPRSYRHCPYGASVVELPPPTPAPQVPSLTAPTVAGAGPPAVPPAATAAPQCCGATRRGPCRSLPLPGLDRCACHYYPGGVGACPIISTSSGKPCGQRVALNNLMCPLHLVNEARRLGKSLPLPGEPLDSADPVAPPPVTVADHAARHSPSLAHSAIRHLLKPVRDALEGAAGGVHPYPVLRALIRSGGGAPAQLFGSAVGVLGPPDDWRLRVVWLQRSETAASGDSFPDEIAPHGVTGLLPPDSDSCQVLDVTVLSLPDAPRPPGGDDPPPHFPRGQAPAPSLTALKGVFLTNLRLRPPQELPQDTEKGLSHQVRAQHRAILRELINLPLQYHHLPLPEALVEYSRERRLSRQWQPTTHLRRLASTMGALSRLDLYTTNSFPVPLAFWAAWRDAMRCVRIETHASQPFPPALSTEQMTAAVTAATAAGRPDLASLLILTWATAARACDVLQLRKDEVHLSKQKLVVQFKRGKGVKFRDPYTIHGAIADQKLYEILDGHLRQGTGPWVWNCDAPSLRQQLQADLLTLIRRAGGPELRQSSIRRGALQHMATMPNVTEEILMHFSGHTDVRTLRRYLGWNLVAATARHTIPVGRAHTAPAPRTGSRA